MSLLGHLSQHDIELIEAGVHPVIDVNYNTKNNKLPKKSKKVKEKQTKED